MTPHLDSEEHAYRRQLEQDSCRTIWVRKAPVRRHGMIEFHFFAYIEAEPESGADMTETECRSPYSYLDALIALRAGMGLGDERDETELLEAAE